ncbi:MAG: antitoxin CptB [Halioglobus sp.]|jgi:antitoxin CptB
MRWAARRGMLELDLLLEPFVEECFTDLSEADQLIFARFMKSEDQDMFGWLMRREKPDDPELAQIVKQILEFSRTGANR